MGLGPSCDAGLTGCPSKEGSGAPIGELRGKVLDISMNPPAASPAALRSEEVDPPQGGPDGRLRRWLKNLFWRWFNWRGRHSNPLRTSHATSPQVTMPNSCSANSITRSMAWCGDIVAANTEDVWRVTTEHIQSFAGHAATLVIVDLTQLRALDLSGANLMVRLKKWARGVQVEILFTHPSPPVRNVLQSIQVDQLLLEGGQ